MRKITIFLISLSIIFIISFFILKEKINTDKIIQKIYNDTGITINLKDNPEWSYYPNIRYKNNLSITNKHGDLIAERGLINIIKNYKINSPFKISYKSPSILYKGINFKIC